MIKAFVFDLDGTLVDTIKDLGTSVNYSLKKHNLKIRELDEYRNFIGNGSKMLIKRAASPIEDESLLKSIYDTYLQHYLDNVCVYSSPYKNVESTLKYLKEKGYMLFVVTNKPDKAAKELITKLFGDTFNEILGIKEGYPTKPDPYLINYIKKEYNLKSEEIVYVGDSDVDMILSNNASIKYKIGCLYGYQDEERLEKYNPYKLINDFSQLLEFVGK